ncbi:MAG: metallophosphoesterase [Myxococcota bacterium]|nr:metallophosphoesterase [Myxococcota bacterium]
MKIAWATDIHLNFLAGEEIDRFGRRVREMDAEAFVVTGDIAEAPSLVPLLRRLEAATEQPAYFVLGNHDFYRGSVAEVRELAAALPGTVGVWLPWVAPVRLGDRAVLVGVDGWGDARLGNPEQTPIRLNDFRLISELVGRSHPQLLERLRLLGDQEALRAREVLQRAIETEATKVLFATHVPPFREACLYKGRPSDDDWAPFFTCKAVGDVLLEYSEGHPEIEFVVLCGHSHCAARVQLRPNLRVQTGAAEYGCPVVEEVHLD